LLCLLPRCRIHSESLFLPSPFQDAEWVHSYSSNGGTMSLIGGMHQIIGRFNLAPYFCLRHKSIKSEDNLRSTTKHSKGDKTIDPTTLPPSYLWIMVLPRAPLLFPKYTK
jgi:hypothetical protein